MSMADSANPIETEPLIKEDTEWVVVDDTGDMAHVIIHNDDETNGG